MFVYLEHIRKCSLSLLWYIIQDKTFFSQEKTDILLLFLDKYCCFTQLTRLSHIAAYTTDSPQPVDSIEYLQHTRVFL